MVTVLFSLSSDVQFKPKFYPTVSVQYAVPGVIYLLNCFDNG